MMKLGLEIQNKNKMSISFFVQEQGPELLSFFQEQKGTLAFYLMKCPLPVSIPVTLNICNLSETRHKFSNVFE